MCQANPHSQTARSVYLDSQGTERPRPEVLDAMLPYLGEAFGNASALAHERGRASRRVIETAREVLAHSVGASSEGVIFTSGATEANNMVLSSFPAGGARHGLIVSAVEHKSVLEPAMRQGRQGARVHIARVDRDGRLDLDRLEALLGPDTALVSVMLANNEIGTIQPVQDVVRMSRAAGALVHVDAAQAMGKLPIDFAALDLDFMTLSAHKFGGPQGIGALITRPQHLHKLQPLSLGGGQEGGLRAGTLPLALCHGMAVAAALATLDIAGEAARVSDLRKQLLAGLSALGPYFVNGSLHDRLSGNLHGGFEGVAALKVMRALPDLHFSIGSACTTGAARSHVLDAIGLDPLRQGESFRLSLGWASTQADVDHVLARMAQVLPRLLPPHHKAGARP